MIAVAAGLLAAAAPAAVSPAGTYRTSQIEMAGALELQPAGGFRYVFDYGAVSEASEGRWRSSDGAIWLTATARPTTADPERSWAVFRSERLSPDGAALVMRRYETVIRFLPVRP